MKRVPSITFNILVMPYEGRYLALCRETGLIRDGSTLEEARDALFSATQTLVQAVERDSSFTPSLVAGLPIRYRVLFDFTVLKILAVYFFRHTMNPLFLRK